MSSDFDTQGHRGCRGLYPENTIPAFKHALELGVKTLELDVVVTQDKEVIVSHEPFMNHEIAQEPDGTAIPKSKEKEFNIYKMDLAEMQKFDVGMQAHARFPDQKKMKVCKPALREMIAESDAYANELNRALPYYNIEIKRVKEHDGEYHPDYMEFTDLVIDVIGEAGIADRTTVQCFDKEVLQYMQKFYPKTPQVYLIENRKSIEQNIEDLGHIPAIYSPYYKFVNAEMVEYCKTNKMQLIPWTVNELDEMQQQINLGVDGIITDFPDRLMSLKM